MTEKFSKKATHKERSEIKVAYMSEKYFSGFHFLVQSIIRFLNRRFLLNRKKMKILYNQLGGKENPPSKLQLHFES